MFAAFFCFAIGVVFIRDCEACVCLFEERFGGEFLAVRFGNKAVFDYGSTSLLSGKKLILHAENRAALKDAKGPGRQFYKYSTAGAVWNNALDRFCRGDVFAVKDGMGSPIFQLFRTNFAGPNTEELYKNMKRPVDRRSNVPYDKDRLIWQAVYSVREVQIQGLRICRTRCHLDGYAGECQANICTIIVRKNDKCRYAIYFNVNEIGVSVTKL